MFGRAVHTSAVCAALCAFAAIANASPLDATAPAHASSRLRASSTPVRDTPHARRPMPLDAAVYVAVCVLMALDYAHNKQDGDDNDLGIVHRDVNPSNIMLARVRSKSGTASSTRRCCDRLPCCPDSRRGSRSSSCAPCARTEARATLARATARDKNRHSDRTGRNTDREAGTAEPEAKAPRPRLDEERLLDRSW